MRKSDNLGTKLVISMPLQARYGMLEYKKSVENRHFVLDFTNKSFCGERDFVCLWLIYMGRGLKMINIQKYQLIFQADSFCCFEFLWEGAK